MTVKEFLSAVRRKSTPSHRKPQHALPPPGKMSKPRPPQAVRKVRVGVSVVEPPRRPDVLLSHREKPRPPKAPYRRAST